MSKVISLQTIIPDVELFFNDFNNKVFIHKHLIGEFEGNVFAFKISRYRLFLYNILFYKLH